MQIHDTDDSIVFNAMDLELEFAAAFDPKRPWIFETSDENGWQQFPYATEGEACKAQRDYRSARGLDPMTGEPL